MISINSLPAKPGCYIYKNEQEEIIYIGKAGNIKKRVSSYFNRKDLDPKTKALVSNINSIDYIITNSEKEALILENNLIKKHQPKYNIDLKDDKTYAYIELTSDKHPRLIISRKRKGKIYGPYTNAQERNSILSILNKTFKLRTCKRLPKKECLRYQMNLCTAPCTKKVSEKEYNEQVSNAEMILKGQTTELIKKLEQELSNSTKKQDFEKSIIIRDQLSAIKTLSNKQLIERRTGINEDVINYEIHEGKVYLMVFTLIKGLLSGKNEFVFDYHKGFINEFLNQYYSINKTPKELILPEKIDESISELYNIKTIIPKRGNKLELLEMVKENIKYKFFSTQKLKEALHLRNEPKTIECFDISHISGKLTVGSMVKFTNGKPDKNNYRRYKIKGDYGIDDYRSMAEVINRRYSKNPTPDLIVVDGGAGQLNYAIKELRKLGINNQAIIGLAKKMEEIYLPHLSVPLQLPNKSPALNLLKAVRDEAHRFAINYNKLLRRKELLK